eukprot:CAMPEP_0114624144 /NCGR_PEP_ID=MMETSP0168-20121206/10620_1 /TAXON_ID=95228 ORGANISM="Vannella sp., Strain DIVA3 517/6/12" /NCGR_SAMPLE_ID=MMETSP0168 /ASSEMBLY_ACC=CAM_ASM_000044 /LENGTH=440 /DNA_ID=CAMNT_0001835419 /DNA_START=91 /DNA_END=1410 /DNA_ORIENTATION=-
MAEDSGRESESEVDLELKEPKVGPIYTYNQEKSTANIWLRGSRNYPFGFVQKKGSTADEDTHRIVFSPTFDYTGVVEVSIAETTEFVSFISTHGDLDETVEIDEDNSTTFTVRFVEKEKSGISFFLASCRTGFLGMEFRRSDAAYKYALRVAPTMDLAIMHGDQIYADPVKNNPVGEVVDFDGYCGRYRKAFTTDGIARLFREVPTYMILDDHEVFNDFVGRKSIAHDAELTDRMNQAFTAYTAYQRRDVVRERDDDYWYTFQHGIHRFFVLDMRTVRDVENGTILGLKQREQFLAWLAEEGEGISFVVTSKPFAPDRTEVGDGWPVCLSERAMILKACAARKSPPVFLGGDAHCSVVSSVYHKDREDPIAHSVVSSGIRSYVYRTPESFKMGTVDMGDGFHYKTYDEQFVSTKNFAIVSTHSPKSFSVSYYSRNKGKLL